MRIASITLYRLELPLHRPYHLALGEVTAFDTILAVAEDSDGRRGFGEATILTGYTPETIAESWPAAAQLARRVAGMETPDAKDLIGLVAHHQPFMATALMTAAEMLEGNPLLEVREPARVPLLAILNETEEKEIAAEIEARLAEGYRTLKVKVGFDANADARRVRFIQDALAGRARIRIDGNQGFGQDDAVRFAGALKPDNIELFEQPCDAGDWKAAEAVAKVSTVPMMMDESIFGPDDIKRAADLGCAKFIKLKLMKAGGLDSLAAGLRLIRERGMTPVLGNGVASDIGCWMEACVARTLIDNAGEMNGFLKPKARVFRNPIGVERGAMVVKAGLPALIDDAALARLAADSHRFTAEQVGA
ncbi:MAG TPA: enolase C-terminal domain-like protein [Rhodospirillales bacterium]|jgi:L-alanine-DL-glutamate epimerase-like enolase superfamily enzyme